MDFGHGDQRASIWPANRTFAPRSAFHLTVRGVGLADEQFPREDELESRQAAGLYPVGRALRATFDAENHDTLGNDLTGLMLQLARVDPDAPPLPRGEQPAAPPSPAASPLPPESARRGWRAMLGRLLGR